MFFHAFTTLNNIYIAQNAHNEKHIPKKNIFFLE